MDRRQRGRLVGLAVLTPDNWRYVAKTARKGRLPCHKAPTCVSFDESADLIHSLRALKKCG